LLELVVALALGAVVLGGTFSLLTSMVQTEVQSVRKGTVNSWSLASLVAMNRDLESASALVYPTNGGADSLSVCTNWSRLQIPPAAVNPLLPNEIFTYCYDSTLNVLRRLRQSGVGLACPALGTLPLACTAVNYPDSTGGGIVATGVYRDTASHSIFTVPLNHSGVQIRFNIGNPAAGVSAGSNGQTNVTDPQTMAFNTIVILGNKQYGNSLD
jgi:hypothetical protein